MADTPRVTVPVEPTEGRRRLELFAGGASVSVAWSDNKFDAMTPFEAIRADLTSMLSAAPAPEGGADAWRIRTKENLHGDGEPAGRWIVSNTLSLSSDTAHWYEIQPLRVSEPSKSDLDQMEAYGVRPALASREEAPAEAGERQDAVVRVSAIAAGATVEHTYGEWIGGFDPAEAFRADLIKVLALRAQPQAREDAQPVWVDGVPTKHHAKEWFIAETTFGDRVVLTALPEEYAYDFKTADETYIKADRIKRWMPFPDSQYLFPHPAPDALRVAVEALREVSALRSNGHGDEWESGFTQGTARAAGIADRALAALRSEQKCGA